MVTQMKGGATWIPNESARQGRTECRLSSVSLSPLRDLARKGTLPTTAPSQARLWLCHVLCGQVSRGCIPLCISKWGVVFPSLGYDGGKAS